MRFIVFKFINLLYPRSLGGCTLSDHISVYYHITESHHIRNPSQGGIISVKSYCAQLCLGIKQ